MQGSEKEITIGIVVKEESKYKVTVKAKDIPDARKKVKGAIDYVGLSNLKKQLSDNAPRIYIEGLNYDDIEMEDDNGN